MEKESKIILGVYALVLLGVFAYIALNPRPITLSFSSEIRGAMPNGKWEIVEVKDYKLDNDTIRFSYLNAFEKEKSGIVAERINYHGGWNEYPRIEARFFFIFLPDGKSVLYEDETRPQLIHPKTPPRWQSREFTEKIFDIGVSVVDQKHTFNF